LTFDDPSNTALINLGAQPLSSLEGIASEHKSIRDDTDQRDLSTPRHPAE